MDKITQISRLKQKKAKSKNVKHDMRKNVLGIIIS